MAWLKDGLELGHGHAGAIAGLLLEGDASKKGPQEHLEALFAAKKAAWRPLALENMGRLWLRIRPRGRMLRRAA